MEFRSLKRQYQFLKDKIDVALAQVIADADFISGREVVELERELAVFSGVKHCISCGNGTDALSLALMAWGIGPGDAIFVPDFTFFASGEVVSFVGAHPIFVDVEVDTYNIDVDKLDKEIEKVLEEKMYKPKAIIAVDLFGQPANYPKLRQIADKYGLKILEDGAQAFGGSIGEKKACSFGDLSTTSFFPMKPLGCYGDGGAIFTDSDDMAALLYSLRVHGKGSFKYDNIRIGMNSRLDTLQAAVLRAKLPTFINVEVDAVNKIAQLYNTELDGVAELPVVRKGFYSSWAQYTIQLKDEASRNGLQSFLEKNGIPSMVYYPKPLHRQLAFSAFDRDEQCFMVTEQLCKTVLSLPIHPYMEVYEAGEVANKIREFLKT